ncbi:hypothetical protein ACHSBP_09260 [Pseudoalteromonas sp. XMcav1-K]|uniref:hypothetical protein n=1 Tax=Pseudoalteromonas sp. XMcav1-K TaxID=3374372 RepID=UPI0037569C86
MGGSVMEKINKAMESQNTDMKMVIIPFMEGEANLSELYECRSILAQVNPPIDAEIEPSNGGFNFIVRW